MAVRKLLLLLFMFLLLMGLALASEKKIHDEWHSYRDTFTKNGLFYDLALNTNNFENLRFKVEDYSVLLGLGECHDHGIYTYCYEDYSFETGKGATITSAGQLVPGVNIVIFEDTYREEAVVRESVYVPGSSGIMEEQEFRVSILNQGNAWANPVSLRISIPGNVTVTSTGSLDRISSGLMVVTSLSPSEEKEFLFKFRPDAFGEHIIGYELVYEFGEESVKRSGSKKLVVPVPYKVSYSLSPKSIEVFGNSDLVVRVENRESMPLNVKRLDIRGPVHAEYRSLRNLRQSWTGIFVGGVESISDSSEFRLRVSPWITGEHKIEGDIVLESFGYEFKESFSETLKVSAEGLVVNAYFDKSVMRTGSNYRFTYELNNNNQRLSFYDFSVVVEGELFNETLSLEELRPMQSTSLLRKELTAPVITEDKVFPVNITTSYTTEAGERITFIEKKEVRVTGAGSLLTLRSKASPSTVEPGGEIIVEVRVSNPTDDYLGSVLVRDEFPGGLIRVSGPVEFRDSLRGGEEKVAYLYKLRVPKDYRYEEIKITTTGSISAIGYSRQEAAVVRVTGIEDPVVVEDENGEEPVVNRGSPATGGRVEEEKEPHFLVRLVNSIGSFFSGLFG